jgi:hypothetical protein
MLHSRSACAWVMLIGYSKRGWRSTGPDKCAARHDAPGLLIAMCLPNQAEPMRCSETAALGEPLQGKTYGQRRKSFLSAFRRHKAKAGRPANEFACLGNSLAWSGFLLDHLLTSRTSARLAPHWAHASSTRWQTAVSACNLLNGVGNIQLIDAAVRVPIPCSSLCGGASRNGIFRRPRRNTHSMAAREACAEINEEPRMEGA